jgi:hypothetical protein
MAMMLGKSHFHGGDICPQFISRPGAVQPYEAFLVFDLGVLIGGPHLALGSVGMTNDKFQMTNFGPVRGA